MTPTPPPTFEHLPEPWFAWFPVRLTNGRLAWLRTVIRTEFVNGFTDYGYRYTPALQRPAQEN